jgi:hypothetical protein
MAASQYRDRRHPSDGLRHGAAVRGKEAAALMQLACWGKVGRAAICATTLISPASPALLYANSKLKRMRRYFAAALRQEVSEDSASAQAAAYLRELGITNRAELSQVQAPKPVL